VRKADTDIAIDTEKQKIHAARWSICSNSLLIVLKLAVAASTGAVSVFAEAIHSFGDLIGATVAMIAVRVSDAPPDDSHAYGHGKFENLSGVASALLMFLAGTYAVFEAIKHLKHLGRQVIVEPGLFVMAFSVVTNILVSRHLLQIGKKTDSAALMADGQHLRGDIYTSFGVFISLLIVKLTGWTWADPAAAIVVSGMIFVTGYKLAGEAVGTLSDSSLPSAEEKVLRDVIAEDPRVLSYHNLRTRKSGSHRHVDVHVLISDSYTFVQAHDFTEELEEKLRQALPNVHPIIHIEPYEAEAQHQQQQHGRQV
jgi:cation diffusion facilitator family transporter